MSERFVTAYSRPIEAVNGSDSAMDVDPLPAENGIMSINSSNDFAKKRLELIVALYYKVLENIMKRERKRLKETTAPAQNGLIPEKMYDLVSNEIFHVALFTCCIEIVVFSYNSKRTFPWIIDVYSEFKDLKFQPYHFYKVIELVIRDEDSLSRGVVKHLNMIEERILEELA